MDVMVWKDKSNNSFRSFFKSCFTLIWNFNFLPRDLTFVENLEQGPLYLGPKSENFQPSTNKLEESPYVFFLNIVLKTWNITYSIVFCCFYISSWFQLAFQIFGKFL